MEKMKVEKVQKWLTLPSYPRKSYYCEPTDTLFPDLEIWESKVVRRIRCKRCLSKSYCGLLLVIHDWHGNRDVMYSELTAEVSYPCACFHFCPKCFKVEIEWFRERQSVCSICNHQWGRIRHHQTRGP